MSMGLDGLMKGRPEKKQKQKENKKKKPVQGSIATKTDNTDRASLGPQQESDVRHGDWPVWRVT